MDKTLAAETFLNRRGEQVTIYLYELAARDRNGCYYEIRTSFNGSAAARTLATAEKRFRSCVKFHKTTRQ